MSDFLKLAYDLIAKVVYYLVEWVVNIFNGFVKLFITGWADYIAIFQSYFGFFNLPLKILAILLMIILVPVLSALIFSTRGLYAQRDAMVKMAERYSQTLARSIVREESGTFR